MCVCVCVCVCVRVSVRSCVVVDVVVVDVSYVDAVDGVMGMRGCVMVAIVAVFTSWRCRGTKPNLAKRVGGTEFGSKAGAARCQMSWLQAPRRYQDSPGALVWEILVGCLEVWFRSHQTGPCETGGRD